MFTPGFIHQFPKLQPNDKLQEGLRANEIVVVSEKGIRWSNRLLLYSGDALVTIGGRLRRMSGVCPTGQNCAGIGKSAA